MKRYLALFLVFVLVAISATLAVGASSARAINPEQSTPEGVVTKLKPYVNDFFHATLYNNGHSYRAPRTVDWLENNPWTLCTSLDLDNAYYCDRDGDEGIFIGYYLFRGLIHGGSSWESGARFADDYAAGVMFVHEWGHHISRILGWRAWAAARGLYAGQELQADCYAGMFTRYAIRIGLVNANDYDWARYILYNIGDGGARYPNQYDSYDPKTHGSGAMRDYWFRVGYANEGNLGACGANLYRVVHGV
jgi:uncharacterized protein